MVKIMALSLGLRSKLGLLNPGLITVSEEELRACPGQGIQNKPGSHFTINTVNTSRAKPEMKARHLVQHSVSGTLTTCCS